MRFNRSIVVLSAIGALLQGCGPADDVEIQDLPALDRGSEEARLGLAEVRGVWRLAGWELATGDTAGMGAELPDYGAIVLQEQRRDSVSGYYVAGEVAAPVVGEVRRDSVVSLVTFLPGDDGRYMVGEVSRDTFWVEASSLPGQGNWRADSRAAFVRSESALDPFRRRKGVPVLALAPDSSAGPASEVGISSGGAPPAAGSASRPATSGPPAAATQTPAGRPADTAPPPATTTTPAASPAVTTAPAATQTPPATPAGGPADTPSASAPATDDGEQPATTGPIEPGSVEDTPPADPPTEDGVP